MAEPHVSVTDFSNPPVVEVVLAVHFKPLHLLRTPQLGALWTRFRERFPIIEEHPSLPPVPDQSGLLRSPALEVRIEMLDIPPVPRLWFLDEAGTQLIQVQQDRFVHNWRKASDGEQYPHYDSVRSVFNSEFLTFDQFIGEEHLGVIEPSLCEVTYIDHIVAGAGWERHGELGSVVTTWCPRYTDGALPEPESVGFTARYPITDDRGEDLGRLTINVEPAFRAADRKPMLVMTFTALGKPMGDGVEGILGFLDAGYLWIIRGFTAITTERMHEVWGRRHDKQRA